VVAYNTTASLETGAGILVESPTTVVETVTLISTTIGAEVGPKVVGTPVVVVVVGATVVVVVVGATVGSVVFVGVAVVVGATVVVNVVGKGVVGG
jgi:hypothetical protein